MMAAAFSAIAATWLTGMIPLAVIDACLQPRHPVPWCERLLFFWGWPLWLPVPAAQYALSRFPRASGAPSPTEPDAHSPACLRDHGPVEAVFPDACATEPRPHQPGGK